MRNGLLTRYAQSDDGAAAVEFALTEPLFLSLIFAIGYAGLMIYSGVGMQTAVERAARCFSVQSRTGQATCSTATSTQSYAQSIYQGVSAPTFVASMQSCGHQVAATLTFHVGWNVPLTAQSCFP
jgi:Flp pilus assembly protein TadG